MTRISLVFMKYFGVFAFIFSIPGCIFFRKITLNYTTAKLPDSQVVYNIKYWASKQADPVKNRLDLFIPTGKNWPTLIFVHGGEWISGDKSLKLFGADIYGNIGRFFAARGIGVAVISYRLMPDSGWKNQNMDVARALNWVYLNIKKYRGNPDKIFIGGHSSGAQLAARVALDSSLLESIGNSPSIICGVILISGAGYDLTDDETYQAAKKVHLFKKLFYTEDITNLKRRNLSPQNYVNKRSPPFLILYAANEQKAFKDGSVNLHKKLVQYGAKSRLLEIPRKNHGTIVLSLSQPGQMVTRQITSFILNSHCP